MSSTPGIGLEPVATGFDPGTTTFTWNASYGQFLSWDAPGYTVNGLGNPASNHGGKIFWTFIDRPATTAVPVTIIVTAAETGTGRILGRSTVTLAWENDYLVAVQEAP
jgi:hypothetical protein